MGAVEKFGGVQRLIPGSRLPHVLPEPCNGGDTFHLRPQEGANANRNVPPIPNSGFRHSLLRENYGSVLFFEVANNMLPVPLGHERAIVGAASGQDLTTQW